MSHCGSPEIVQAAPRDVHQGVQAARGGEFCVTRIEQPGAEAEQNLASLLDKPGVQAFVEQGRPAGFKPGEFCALDPAREKLGRGGSQPRLGRRRLGIKLFKLFTPPGEFDRCQGRFSRAGHYFAHSGVDIEQGVEGGPQLNRPVEPDQIAVSPWFSDS